MDQAPWLGIEAPGLLMSAKSSRGSQNNETIIYLYCFGVAEILQGVSFHRILQGLLFTCAKVCLVVVFKCVSAVMVFTGKVCRLVQEV